MQIQLQKNCNYSNKTNFGALKDIKCISSSCRCHKPCSVLENNVIQELKELAKVDKFFKENDVEASITVKRFYGTELKLVAYPVAKNFKEKVKNFFTLPKIRVIRDSHSCPDESTFGVAKKLREKRKLVTKQNSGKI